MIMFCSTPKHLFLEIVAALGLVLSVLLAGCSETLRNSPSSLPSASPSNDVDFITVHIYPFWQKISIASAIRFLDQTYTRVKQAFPGKQIVIGETGWPSAGPSYGAAVPSAANQARYLREFTSWAQAKRVQSVV